MPGLSDISAVDVLLATAGAGAVASSCYLMYNFGRQFGEAPRIVRESNEQYLDDMPLQELCSLYNRLLPASRRTFGKVRRSAEELVEKVELRLCEEIAQECAHLGGKGQRALEDIFLQSPTFLSTFNKHYYGRTHYANQQNPQDAINHVMDVMGTQDLGVRILQYH